MDHSGSTANHNPFAATYADAAARTAATGFERQSGGGIVAFSSDDVGKLVRQSDDNSVWMLIATTPTWLQITGTGSLAAAVAGAGLGYSSGVLAVNVDNSTIEINSDTLRAKDSGITDAKLATSYTKADGSRAFTGDQSMGSHKLTNVTDPASAQDAATKAYVDALLAAADAVLYKGTTDCSSNPNYPAASAGHLYMVSVAGKIGGASGIVVTAGDMFICKTDGSSSGDQATVGTNWNVIQTNIAFTPENEANKDTDTTLAANSDTKYASQKAIKAYVDGLLASGGVADDSITNAKLANMAASTVKMRKTGSTGDPEDATMAELYALLKPQIPVQIGVAVSDETTAITTGTAKVTFRMPFAMTVTAVRSSLTTASSSGNPTVDINEAGTTILSTKLSIDSGELTSTTAATAAVISDSALADDAEITIDIDTSGTGAKGLKVWIIGTRT